MISASALLLVLRRFYYVGRYIHIISVSALVLVLRRFYYVGKHVYLLVFRHFYYMGRHVSVPYHTVPSGIYCTESHSFFISGRSKRMFIRVYLNKKI